MMSDSCSEIIDLNVGGVFYTTQLKTLTTFTDSLLSNLFGDTSARPTKDTQDRYFIDRDGQLFRYIIDYLRTGEQFRLPENFTERERLIVEAEYFQLNNLVAFLKQNSSSKGSSITATGLASGYITVGYRGSFAFGRDGLADVKFRKLTRILVAGKVNLCREVFGETLNESRDPDSRGIDDRYTARFYLKHLMIEMAFDNLQEAGFRCVASCGSGTSCGASNEPLKPGVDSEESRWNHYNEFLFVRP